MFRYVLILLSGFALVASAESFLTRETHFFGIPNLDSLSTNWFLERSNWTDFGYGQPMDMDVLRLSASDYRMVVLSSDGDLFTEFRLDQRSGLSYNQITHSGQAPANCKSATAMCQIRHGTYFNPLSDRVAVTFADGARVGIYRFDTGVAHFVLERSFGNTQMLRPVAIFWAFDQFFIGDDSVKTIFRTDTLGNVITRYGRPGYFDDGYDWISSISGTLDGSNTAHLYVGDGSAERVDHLTATVSNPAILLHVQALAQGYDTLGTHISEAEYVPGAGVVGLDPFRQVLYCWSDSDSLGDSSRARDSYVTSSYPAIHICQAAGRLVVISLSGWNWVLRSYNVTGATFDDPIPYPTDHWTIDISPVIISDVWHVTNGTNLIIDHGVEVQFERHAELVVDGGGRLTANGTSGNRVVFHAAQSSQNWTGIKLESGAALNMVYSTVSDADSFCVFANTPGDSTGTPLHIAHCYFDGSKLISGADALRILGNPQHTMSVTDSRIDKVTNGRGLYLYNCTANFYGDTIQGCDTANTYLKQVSGKFVNCVFEGRAKGHGVLFGGSGCTPNFQCCLFKDLASKDGAGVPLLALKGAGPTLGWEDISSNGVSNVISDSATALLHFYDDKVMPIIDNVNPSGGPGGKNDWYQHKRGGYYLYWEDAMGTSQYPAENQYWNNGVRNGDFYPSNSYFALDTTHKDPWGLCGSGLGLMVRRGSNRGAGRNGQGLDDLVSDLALFSDAMTAELSENFADAQTSFHGVVAATADEQLRWQSLSHIVSTQRHLNGEMGDDWIPSLIDSAISVDSNAYGTRVYGNRLLAGYRTDREQYSQAMTICTDLLNSQLTYGDSLLVAIDLIGIQMLADSGSSGGGLDSPHRPNIPAGLRVFSVTQGLMLEGELLRLLGTSGHAAKTAATIPANYRLYQNYPNPFNPTTEIRFDLPEATHVELKIYNTLGQLVTTLLNETRPAGAYHVAWNASRVASGLYIYRLNAGKFSDTKKMLLIR